MTASPPTAASGDPSETLPAAYPEIPAARTCPFQPPALYAQLRSEQGPLAQASLYDGRTVKVVVGHAQARTLLTDPRVSSDWADPDFPSPSPRRRGIIAKVNMLIGQDAPEHTRYRKLLVPTFTLRRIAELRPAVQRTADRLLDDILARGPQGGVDLFADYALPVSSTTICTILGVPYADHEFFERQTARLVAREATEQDALKALIGLRQYLAGLVETKRKEPGDGLIDALLAQTDAPDADAPDADGPALTGDDVTTLSILLLMAGHETTASMIALGTYTLLSHPDQLAALRADPALLPSGIEELLRYLSIADIALRIAKDDIEIDGTAIKRGDGILLPNAGINRDPEAFPDPDVFDVARGARQHTAFGYGIHQCLGQNLARMEMEIALGTLFARIPTLRVAVPDAELDVKPAHAGVQGIYALPVTW
ncbi:MAG: cytochrome P450 [Streptomycetaceae bacterium]|nr:cytochrome P450 [Streptomycetaceae bacterium]